MNAHATQVADATDYADLGSQPQGGAMIEATPQRAPAPAAVAADGLLGIIERIAVMPNASLDALDRVMSLRERMAAAEAKAAFDCSLSDMQPRLPSIDANGKITIYSKADRDRGRDLDGTAAPIQTTRYATMADINDAIKPALAEFGFALSFRSAQVEEGEHKGKIIVTGILSHRQGHRETITLPPMMYDTTGSKNNVQGLGSTLSYGRRYATLLLLNISSRAPQDMDDDGQAAGNRKAAPKAGEISDEQAAEIEKLIEDTDSETTGVLAYVGARSVIGMTADQFTRAKAELERKKARIAARKAAQ